MTYRPQPADLAFAPPRYPSHRYTGTGEVVTVRVSPTEVVGYLSRQGATIAWDACSDLDADARTVAQMVTDLLRRRAAESAPLVRTWAEILNKTRHDAPRVGPLSNVLDRLGC